MIIASGGAGRVRARENAWHTVEHVEVYKVERGTGANDTDFAEQ